MTVNTERGKRAVTHFKVIERFKDTTYIKATLETGIPIRYVYICLILDIPLLAMVFMEERRKIIEGQVLHAKELGFVHPSKMNIWSLKLHFLIIL